MKAYLRYAAAALLTIACGRPENDLFGNDLSRRDDGGSVGSLGGSSVAGTSDAGRGGKGSA